MSEVCLNLSLLKELKEKQVQIGEVKNAFSEYCIREGPLIAQLDSDYFVKFRRQGYFIE